MTPAGRMQAAIELLDDIIVAARDGGAAADTILARGFKARRYAGSGDRRAIRELVYAAIRMLGDRPASGRAAMLAVAAGQPDLAAAFDGSAHGPARIEPGEPVAAAGVMPSWLRKKIGAVMRTAAMEALLERAPLDLRVNRAMATREAVLAELPGSVATPHSPDGIRLTEPIAIEDHPLYEAGLIEVQDEGSQLIAEVVRAGPGMLVVDLCAGAGGKALALAATGARVIACDTDRGRLSRLPPRAERAGATIETRLLDPGRERDRLDDLIGLADAVLIDAPCSGTGTWRRNPEARWRLTPARLTALTTLQARLLDLGAPLVRPGGALVYAVCSLLPEEGPAVMDGFLARSAGWRAVPPTAGVGDEAGVGVRLHPARHGTDGFFIARSERPC